MMDINVTHPIRLTQLAVQYFVKHNIQDGQVLHVSSIAAQSGVLGVPMYAASKATISHFVRQLAGLQNPPADSGVPGIIINAVAPGMVWTPLWSESALAQSWMGGVPSDWLQPEEIAEGMWKLVTDPQYRKGGVVLEVTKGSLREVQILNDPGTPADKAREGLPTEKLIEHFVAGQKPVWDQVKSFQKS
jgi:NAD(P)-dependent dehydrogenase (short-subunit alcohol dehydrogenase family)